MLTIIIIIIYIYIFIRLLTQCDTTTKHNNSNKKISAIFTNHLIKLIKFNLISFIHLNVVVAQKNLTNHVKEHHIYRFKTKRFSKEIRVLPVSWCSDVLFQFSVIYHWCNHRLSWSASLPIMQNIDSCTIFCLLYCIILYNSCCCLSTIPIFFFLRSFEHFKKLSFGNVLCSVCSVW